METIRNEITTNQGGDKVKKFLDDERILAALIGGGSIRRAATIAGISPATIRNRLNDDQFRQRYEAEKREILETAVDNMKASLVVAIDTLTGAMGDGKATQSVRIQAADALLRHCVKYVTMLDFDRRLTALEQAQAEELEDVEG